MTDKGRLPAASVVSARPADASAQRASHCTQVTGPPLRPPECQCDVTAWAGGFVHEPPPRRTAKLRRAGQATPAMAPRTGAMATGAVLSGAPAGISPPMPLRRSPRHRATGEPGPAVRAHITASRGRGNRHGLEERLGALPRKAVAASSLLRSRRGRRTGSRGARPCEGSGLPRVVAERAPDGAHGLAERALRHDGVGPRRARRSPAMHRLVPAFDQQEQEVEVSRDERHLLSIADEKRRCGEA